MLSLAVIIFLNLALLVWCPSTAEVKLAKVAARVAIIYDVIGKTKSNTCISYNYMYLGKHFWVKVGRRGP